MKKTDFTKAITEYFVSYLPITCGASPKTCESYRDTFRLLIQFFHDQKGIPASNIELNMMKLTLISEFLEWLEIRRNVSISTRNQRLAALKAFFRYAQYRYPEYMDNYINIMNLRPKKHEKTLIPFLTEDEIHLLFCQVDKTTPRGLRDLALMVLLYDSGARVQELVSLQLKDIRLAHPATVILVGKGNKARQVPLMKDTCKLMNQYIRTFHKHNSSGETPLFFNSDRKALSRFGVTYILKKYAEKAAPVLDPKAITPHVLRHTKAMHLLRAGVAMVYIRDFLGHADISTTEIYARIDAEMKRKVFEKSVPNYTPETAMPWEEDEDLLQWLNNYGKKIF